MALMAFIFLPVIFIIGATILWFKNKRLGLGYSFLMVAISAAVFVWSIFQSRSSTAAIGLLFVPAYSVICGFLVWGYFQLWTKPNVFFKAIAIGLLVSSAGFCGFGVYAGLKEKFDRGYREKVLKETQTHIQWIIQNKANHSGNEAGWLENEVKNRSKDEAFLKAALSTDFINSQTLAIIAETENINLLASVVSHKNSSSEFLNSIYSKQKDNSRLDVAFSMNNNTPTDILETIFQRSPFVGYWLSENKNVSMKIVEKLVQSKDMEILNKIVNHSKLDCDSAKLLLIASRDSSVSDYKKVRDDLVSQAKEKVSKLCISQ